MLKQIEEKVGRHYEIFEYTGHPEAESVMVIMSSAALTAEAVVEAMAKEGKKVGVINIRLWRPFDMEYFISKLPKTVKNIVAMDRARDFTSNGELLYKEVLTALFKSGRM